jgi:hypothetical protein
MISGSAAIAACIDVSAIGRCRGAELQADNKPAKTVIEIIRLMTDSRETLVNNATIIR